MKVMYGSELSFEIRKQCDSIKSRLWISSPFIGGADSVLRVLGNCWVENPAISVRLLTDASDFSNFNLETLNIFSKRGHIHHLNGLHAKIYIMDDKCVITSANLTQTAFAKRYEVGILLEGAQAKNTISAFEEWWKKAEVISTIVINKNNKSSKSQSKEDQKGISLPVRWAMPPAVKFKKAKLKKKFLDYPSIIMDYQDFARKYENIQRIWKDAPLFLEVDEFLNYLYHEYPGRKSSIYRKKAPRSLSNQEQINEIKKYAKEFAKFAKSNPESVNLKDKIKSQRMIRRGLSLNKVDHLTKEEIMKVFGRINALGSYPINKTKIFSFNKLPLIRKSLKNLIHGKEELPARMSKCNELKHMGTSTINELIGFYYPSEFPIVNKNSNCGMRFFGYDIPAYR